MYLMGTHAWACAAIERGGDDGRSVSVTPHLERIWPLRGSWDGPDLTDVGRISAITLAPRREVIFGERRIIDNILILKLTYAFYKKI